MTSFENRLRDALTARAQTVQDDGRPHPLPAPRQFAPRRWRVPIAAAAAIATVVAGVAMGARVLDSPRPAAEPSPTPSRQVFDEIAPPMADVWPEAVHRIPVKAPGGQDFRVSAFVDERTVVGKGLIKSRPRTIWTYDLDTRKFTEIAPLAMPGIMNDALVHGEGMLAWNTFAKRTGEIWTVPLTGGTPRRVTTFPVDLGGEKAYHGIELAIGDGHVVWSRVLDGGVHRAPLSGGAPEPVPGADGMHLLDWPWAGRPGHKRSAAKPSSKVMVEVLNLSTGERDEAKVPKGKATWRCGVDWCLDGSREARRRDGGDRRDLPGQLSEVLSDGGVLLHQKAKDGQWALALHDLDSGRTGGLGRLPTRKGDPAPPTLYLQDGLIYRREGGEQTVVNLAALG